MEDGKDRSYFLDYTFSKNEKSSLGASLKGVKVHHDGKLLLQQQETKGARKRTEIVGLLKTGD